MTFLTTNIYIVCKRLALVMAFMATVFASYGIAHAKYIAPPSTVGEAVVLIDADTKEILFSNNPDK